MGRKRLLVALGLTAVAILAVHGSVQRPMRWTPDGLFYQARVLELRGATHDEAFQAAFEGPIAAHLRQIDPEHSGNPTWIAYNERFFERRVAVPIAGAAIYGAAGERSLSLVSLTGYLAAVLAIFALLLVRFSLPVAAAVGLLTALLPVLTDNAPLPHTDTWGLALLSASLAAAILTFERGRRWLPVFGLAILLLAFTRDSAWVALLAIAWCTFRWRSRAGAELLGVGLLALLPAALLFPLPLRELLAFAVNDFTPAPQMSWTEIASRYPGSVVEFLHSDAGFIREGHLATGAFFALGLVLLVWMSSRADGDRAVALVRAAAFAAIPYILIVPQFSGFRIELVMVPAAAYGLALGAGRIEAYARQRLPHRQLAGGAVVPALVTRNPERAA
jgi:hypothetical protein